MTKGQRRRLIRDLTISFASRVLKLSQRQIADAFELPHSRIDAILQTMAKRASQPGEE